MSWNYFFVLKDYLKKKRLFTVISHTVAIIGIEWLILEFSSFCIPGIPNTFIPLYGFFILPVSFFVAFSISLYINRPISQVSEKLKDRDIEISIVIGDFFDQKGDYIIGTNTTFETDMQEGIISKNSIQGQFTLKYFKDNINDLDKKIDEKLKSVEFTTIANGKRKNKKYPMGETILIKNDTVVAYFVALADMNSDGVASSSYSNIVTSLSKLWTHISSHGSTGSLIIPILGTGFSRIETAKEQIIQEIIKTFIKACSTKRFTHKLTIVIYSRDYRNANLDLDSLGEFLKCQCKYAEFK